MALIGNAGLNARGPIRNFGITSPGNERSAFQQRGPLQNFPLHEGRPTGGNKTGYPSGRKHPYSWSMPFKPGGMASILNAQGAATLTANAAGGVNGAVTMAGVGSMSAIGQLVVSGQVSMAGTSSMTANVRAALGGTLSSAGTSTMSGSMTAKGWATVSMQGQATVSPTLTAVGHMAISVAPAVQLEASTFSTYLLDQEDVESGLTLRKALRLIAAATAGKVSGASGNTVTIKNAVADSKDRIVATVDANGNRTAITYDLED